MSAVALALPSLAQARTPTAGDLHALQAGDQPVHVWHFRSDQRAPGKGLSSLLAADELARAQRIQNSAARHRFLSGRMGLRLIVGGYLGVDPQAVGMRYGAFGKPRLAEPSAARELAISVTYAGPYVAVAVCGRSAVGIDAELTATFGEAGERVDERRLQRRALNWLAAQPPGERGRMRARLWVVQQAWLKALGQGFASNVELVDVVLPEMRAAGEGGSGAAGEIALHSGRQPVRDWFAVEPQCGNDWTVAVVGAGAAGPVVVYRMAHG